LLFSSSIFLYCFLPIVLIGSFLAPKKAQNFFLLIASLFFYAWGEKAYLLVMLSSILLNFITGIGIGKVKSRKTILSLGVLLNLLLLIYYKYFNFIVDNIHAFLLQPNEKLIASESIHLPIGISFFTFQGISYIVDVYKKNAIPERNPINLGLYISLFPQLIAGPIVRYSTIMDQIKQRVISLNDVSLGVKRFIIGLSKKMIIANTLGEVADNIINSNMEILSFEVAWLGIICYSLQIFFDFSGYSDMAIGLGKMLGFNFEENFNLPYISTSIKEFWRRWHISLSSWFRDYLYIPLGGNKKGKARTYLNLFLVFLLTGVWHGASWNFIIWGLFHGSFLIVERLGLDRLLNQLYRPFRHLYALTVVVIGWVFFRIEQLPDAFEYLQKMFSFNSGSTTMEEYLNNYTLFILMIGILFSIQIKPNYSWIWNKINAKNATSVFHLKQGIEAVFIIFLFLFSCSEIANNTYNPFIYFRF
jgi:alginate O-acetyltransferase complex protein AlgI